MAYTYTVTTNQGTFDVNVARHHDHMTKADFERLLFGALVSLGSGVVLHHYKLKVR